MIDYFYADVPVVSHLAKFLIVSSEKDGADDIEYTFSNYRIRFLNYAQIYEENREVILRSFHKTRNLKILRKFKNFHRENLSKIIFSDNSRDLYGQPLHVLYHENNIKAFPNKWTFFLEIVAKKLNSSIIYTKVKPNYKTDRTFSESYRYILYEFMVNATVDFDLTFFNYQLESYSYIELCFVCPPPKTFFIYELILILPLDNSCWMALGLTILLTAIIWRIFEGPKSHLRFLFGIYSLMVGQFSDFKIRS